MAECLFGSPNWCSGMSCLTSINDFNQFKRNFSNMCDKLGRSDIGLYEDACSGGYSGVISIITRAHFQCLGTHSVRSIVYNYVLNKLLPSLVVLSVFLGLFGHTRVTFWIDVRIDFFCDFNQSEVFNFFSYFVQWFTLLYIEFKNDIVWLK